MSHFPHVYHAMKHIPTPNPELHVKQISSFIAFWRHSRNDVSSYETEQTSKEDNPNQSQRQSDVHKNFVVQIEIIEESQ